MVRSENFIKRKIGTGYAIVAVGEATKHFNGIISVNKTGSFIWDQLKKTMTMAELTDKLTEEYGVDAATAAADAEKFLEVLRGVGAIAD